MVARSCLSSSSSRRSTRQDAEAEGVFGGVGGRALCGLPVRGTPYLLGLALTGVARFPCYS
jgi:hypothetical protein